MADFEIQPQPDGRFAVIEVRPVELAKFHDEFHAEVFLKWLREQPVHGVQVPVTPEVRAELRSTTAAKPAAAASAAPPIQDPVQAPLEPDWDAALKRIKGGEKVKDVAAEIGVPFPKLRGRWAAYRRANPEASSLEAVLEPVPEPTKDTANSPVSGGVGAALQRGQKPWEQVEIDALNLAEATGTSVAAVAKQLGRSEDECRRKMKQIDAGIQRDLQEQLS